MCLREKSQHPNNMNTLQNQTLFLRALEPEDLDFIYQIENDETVWEISHTKTPYSRFLIRQYLENAQQDIYEAKQLRFVICLQSNQLPIGMIDLFDFEPAHHRAGVGVLIYDKLCRNEGIGSGALALVMQYAQTHLNLHQLYANIGTDNAASVALFTKFGFQEIGIKKQWNLVRGAFKDEGLYQYIFTK